MSDRGPQASSNARLGQSRANGPRQQRNQTSLTVNIRPSTVISVTTHILQQNNGQPMHMMLIQKTMVDSGLITNCPLPLLEAILLKEIQFPQSKIKMVDTGLFALTTEEERLTNILQQSMQQQSQQTRHESHQTHQSSSLTTHHAVNGNIKQYDNEKYKKKYKRLRKIIKDQIFTNAAVCDEVSRLEIKLHRVKEERRFLLKKLYQYQALSDATSHIAKQQMTSPVSMATQPSTSTTKKTLSVLDKSKKRVLKKKGTAKNSSVKTVKKLCQPIAMKSNGQPLFPVDLGHLSIHSLGQVFPDRVGFHTAQYIYPVGFVSSRTYASWVNIDETCCYVCKILDGGNGPRFEVLCDDGSDQKFVGSTASDCHTQLLKAVNKTCGRQVVPTVSKGPDFFGISHPTIQNLIQRLPGSEKCDNYKKIHFEVCLPEQGEVVTLSDNDPTVNLDVLLKSTAYKQGMLQHARDQESQDDPALRNLLSK